MSGDPVRIARLIYRIAAIYGLIVLLPLFLAEDYIARHAPPAITHPEYFYGFLGAASVMQLFYLVIAGDPLRYRPLMPLAMVAKLSFAVVVAVLFLQGRLAAATLPLPTVDFFIGIAFGYAWWRVRRLP